VGTIRQLEVLTTRPVGGTALLADLDLVMKDASICGLGHTAGTAVRSALDLGLVDLP
jgi:NADH-quinone oxidoreductase subunit F